MPRIAYNRIDLSISIRRARDGSAQISVSTAGVTASNNLTCETVSEWCGAPDGVIPRLEQVLQLNDAIGRWESQMRWPLPPQSSVEQLYRVTVHIDDPTLAPLDWETSLIKAFPSLNAPQRVLVRLSSIRPRVLAIPLTFPMRIL